MNGILIINKDLGYTSRDVVNVISKQISVKSVGHTGTLDPLATGVLVVCVGKAVKVCELLTNHDKEYIADITLGIETDTLDMGGKIISSEDVSLDKEKIYDVVRSFKKEYLQEVPKYSAVKVKGKKLYEYARENTYVELPVRKVKIHDIEIIDEIVYHDGKINFKIKCTVSKGTYIRSLVRDIGESLGVSAVMSGLVRTKVGDFSLDNAVTLEDIKDNKYNLIKIEDAFLNIGRIVVDESDEKRVRNGAYIDKFLDEEMKFIFNKDHELLALYKNSGDRARAYKMFL